MSLVLVISLSGCDVKNHIYHTKDIFMLDENHAVLLKSESDCLEYKANATEEEFLSSFAGYDASFFEENMLIAIFHHTPYFEGTVSVKSVDYEDSEIIVTLKYRFPRGGMNELEGCASVLIEIPKNDQYTKVTYRVQYD